MVSNFIKGCVIKSNYGSLDAAKTAISKRYNASGVQLYPYLCPHCLKYHITKEKNGTDVAKTRNIAPRKISKTREYKQEIGKLKQETNNLKQKIDSLKQEVNSKTEKIVELSSTINKLNKYISASEKQSVIRNQEQVIKTLRKKLEIQITLQGPQAEELNYWKKWVKETFTRDVYFQIINRSDFPKTISKLEAIEIVNNKEKQILG